MFGLFKKKNTYVRADYTKLQTYDVVNGKITIPMQEPMEMPMSGTFKVINGTGQFMVNIDDNEKAIEFIAKQKLLLK